MCDSLADPVGERDGRSDLFIRSRGGRRFGASWVTKAVCGGLNYSALLQQPARRLYLQRNVLTATLEIRPRYFPVILILVYIAHCVEHVDTIKSVLYRLFQSLLSSHHLAS